jgi:hypothetical protein
VRPKKQCRTAKTPQTTGIPKKVKMLEELVQALLNLTGEDVARLGLFASRLLRSGAPWATPQDLMYDAMAMTFLGTCCSEGTIPARAREGKPWRDETSLVAHLCMTMRSMASDAATSAYQKGRTSLDALFPEAGALDDPAGFMTDGWPSIALSPEWQVERQQLVTIAIVMLLERFRNDKRSRWVVKGLRKGMSAQEICTQTGMLMKDFEMHRKRVERAFKEVCKKLRMTWNH